MEPTSNPLPFIPIVVISLLGNSLDLFLVLLFTTNENWDILRQFLISSLNINLVIDLAKAFATLCSLFTLLQIYRYVKGLQNLPSGLDGFTARPMLFPSQTAHTRLFPTKHSFSYSYLMVGIPVGWKGSAGRMISADLNEVENPWYLRWLSLKPGGAWFTVNGDDYLARGHVEGGLEEKLDVYLRSQNEDPSDYPYAYLLTAPRFLNYSSNPVSIWNLYSPTKHLSALILEVNNTFDERHIYFLKSSPYPLSVNLIPSCFKQTWPKDFYVSVFNSRTGTYSISTTSPLSPSFSGPGNINTTITLSSSKNHPKLIARIFSTSPALDPTTMSVLQKTSFVAKWWWVGLATFPRTIQQAMVILRKKGLNWVFRPEPRKNTMPRRADALEQFIEPIFRRYLRNTVEKSESTILLRYTPAGLLDTAEEFMISPSAQISEVVNISELEIRVLTPIFYSRFVQYPNSLDGMFSESNDPATISISNLTLLSTLDFPFPTSSPVGLLPKLHFSFLKNFRKRPAPIENTESIASKNKTKIDSPVIPITLRKPTGPLALQSEFDAFVLSHSSLGEQKSYAAKLLKLLLAEYIAFGWMDILDLEVFVIRCLAAWVSASRVWS